jgi:serine/threonine protein phosphatase PrpC/CRP-like cAMP-binding protein
MQLQVFGQSDVGNVRTHNEDTFRIDAELGLYVVCDGMGGHAAGEVASQTAANELVRFIAAGRDRLARFDGSAEGAQDLVDLVTQAIMHASKVVFDVASGDRGKHGMGTTCVLLLAVGDKGIAANVGDSRLYMVRDGRLYQLSTDHNFINEAVAQGMLSPEQAAVSPHAHVLTRAVGTQPSVCPDLLVFDILPGDTFLLCSDGLHEYTKDAEELRSMLSVTSLKDIPGHLVRRALSGGGHDNITAIVARAVAQDGEARARRDSIVRDLDAVRDIELFRELTLPEVVKVYNLLTPLVVEAKTAIIREGDASAHLFVITEGSVGVQREGADIASLGAGAHFGEMALLNQKPRSATVIAEQRTTLLKLSRDDFHALLAHEPAIASKFLWKFAQTLSLRLDDAYLARDLRLGRRTMGVGEF